VQLLKSKFPGQPLKLKLFTGYAAAKTEAVKNSTKLDIIPII